MTRAALSLIERVSPLGLFLSVDSRPDGCRRLGSNLRIESTTESKQDGHRRDRDLHFWRASNRGLYRFWRKLAKPARFGAELTLKEIGKMVTSLRERHHGDGSAVTSGG